REGVPVMYLPVPLQAELLTRAGVKDNQTVIIYSDGESVPGATMMAYVLEKIGHPDIKIIDGGWTAYKATQKTSQQYPRYKPGRLSVHQSKTYVTTDEVVKAAGKPGYKLIDARDRDDYLGQTKLFMRNGHIPGAISIPWPSLMEKENQHKFKAAAEQQAIYDANGVKKSDTIILYCGTSRDASVQYAVLKHMLGYPKVLLYEGSWTEYVSHPELPIKVGPEP
ncbi:MAG TPA: rhodanese-like domain-containing protein, partial [Chloroflexota bacterium]|nr:rhodanese-like domain-containing protein [Chloroflexota bacterium]